MPPKYYQSGAGRMPLLPLKDAVIFPRMVVPLLVGRPASLAAIEESLAREQPLFLCTQHDPEDEQPAADGLYRIGVAANVLQTTRMPDGTLKIVVEGLQRGKVQRFYLDGPVPEVLIRPVTTPASAGDEIIGLIRSVLEQFEKYSRNSQRIAPEIIMSLKSIDDPDMLADMVSGYLPVRVDERQQLLENLNVASRLEQLIGLLMRENELFEIERSVRDRVREQMERGQREHYLQEQLRAIHQELGGREDSGDDYSELREMIAKARMPKDVREKADREMARYQRMPPMSPEGAIIRTYLEWLCEMPWRKRTRDVIDLKVAQKVLDEDHYGLEKVKERILEFLAVRKMSNQVHGPVLCLVGPPGVGKTSLGQSIARAMGRKFVRVSLGGVRDEAEIRGHRRTYIGALPGRMIQSLKKAGVRNPVFMLDEIDKMSTDFRGDPSSALLEVLDPAQNKNFSDHYLEVEFDLTHVFFITTANNLYDIPHPLRDRMEIVRMPGYTSHEKLHIAKGFLVRKQRQECGLTEKKLEISDAGIETIISRYTREAGVRELERQIAAICRKITRRFVAGEVKNKVKVGAKEVMELLGPPIFTEALAESLEEVGVAIGMAWTEAGGDILHIETSTMKGKGKLTLTGQLGDVMKESAQAAHTYLRAHAEDLKIPAERFSELDVHVHVPEGAIPKDGPSAGVAIAVSMLSALLGVAGRSLLSMTGEITLRGRVLPVGGIKEKVLAAHRAGVRSIVLPKENEKDLPDIPQDVLKDIQFTLAERIDEVFAVVFQKEKPPAAKPVRSKKAVAAKKPVKAPRAAR
jgi:ATP-dependent Lon protease